MLSRTERKLMTEAAILEKIETLNQAVVRLQERVEDLEDLRDLEAAIAENAGKPLITCEQVKAELKLDSFTRGARAAPIIHVRDARPLVVKFPVRDVFSRLGLMNLSNF